VRPDSERRRVDGRGRGTRPAGHVRLRAARLPRLLGDPRHHGRPARGERGARRGHTRRAGPSTPPRPAYASRPGSARGAAGQRLQDGSLLTAVTVGRAKFLGCVVAGLALALVVPRLARADVRTEARRHFRQGMALIAAGDIDAGIRELEQAYETLPHPNVLYNIGRAYAESGRYAESIEYFERYLESDPADRAEVLGFLEALRARIAARAERQRAREAQTPSPQSESAEVGTGTLASEQEIEALEESAIQIETLAESSQNEALRRRAEQLRAL